MRRDVHRDGWEDPEAMTWRQRRVLHLAELVASGSYDVPPIEVAHAILHGRPRWGDNPRATVGGPERLVVRAGIS